MPKGIGYIGDPDHDSFIKLVDETDAYYEQQLQPFFDQFLPNWKLYLAMREDKRKEDEKWRANVFVPYPYSGLETKIEAMLDIMDSADRWIQMEGVDADDERNANPVELALDHVFRKNKFRSRVIGQLMRSGGVQGAQAYQVVWRRRTTPVDWIPEPGDLADLKEKVSIAIDNGAPKPPDPVTEPAQFRLWRDMVLTSKKVDSMPDPTRRDVVLWNEPYIKPFDISYLRFDPCIDEWEDQPIVIKHSVVSEEWLHAQVKAGEFDEEQVAAALSGPEGSSGGESPFFNEWRKEQAALMGTGVLTVANPLLRNPHVIREVFQPRQGIKYAVVLNNKAVINKDVEKMPYAHGGFPVGLFVPQPVPGFAIGLSHFHQPKSLYYEMNTLRSMRLDAVLISLLPILLREKDAGMPELRRVFRPGTVLDVNRASAVQQLVAKTVDPAAFREIFDIKQDIDETEATGGNVRGGQATIGRVSASESNDRTNRALVRMKGAVRRVEDQIDPMVKQALWLMYEFMDAKMRFQIGGGKDPFAYVAKSEVYEALDRDFRFRGATRVLNRELLAQQSMAWGKEFGANLAPVEMRSLMRRSYIALGLRGEDEVIQPQFTEIAQKAWESKMGMVPGAGGVGGGGEAAMPPEGSTPPSQPGQKVDMGQLLAEAMQRNEGGGLGPSVNPNAGGGPPVTASAPGTQTPNPEGAPA